MKLTCPDMGQCIFFTSAICEGEISAADRGIATGGGKEDVRSKWKRHTGKKKLADALKVEKHQIRNRI